MQRFVPVVIALVSITALIFLPPGITAALIIAIVVGWVWDRLRGGD